MLPYLQEVSFVNELKEYTQGKNGLMDDKNAAAHLARLLNNANNNNSNVANNNVNNNPINASNRIVSNYCIMSSCQYRVHLSVVVDY